MKGRKSAVVVLVAVALLLAGTVIGARAMLTGNEQQPAGLSDPSSAVWPAEEVGSVAEAEAVLGQPIPLPAYLPSGYEVQQIYVGGTWNVTLLFSNEEIVPCLDSAIATWEKEFQRAGGARLVLDMQRVETAGAPDVWEDVDIPGDVVDLGQVKGLLVDPGEIDYPSDHQVDDIWYLEWSHSKFSFTLKAPKGLPREEVIRIASSVPVLNSPLAEVSLDQAESILGVAIRLDLPEGYEIRRAFVWGDETVYVLISDSEIGKLETESQLADIVARPNEQAGAKIILKVEKGAYPDYDLFDIFLGEGELRDFDGSKAIVHQSTGYHDLEWFTDEARFRLKASQTLSADDLAAIVRSGG